MLRTGLDKSEKNRAGVPDPKKFERTGKDTFVVHADGGNYFEGKVEDPSVKLKDSGKVIITGSIKEIVNVCWECANNHFHNEGVSDEICFACNHKTHNNFKQKVKNA